MTKTVKNIEVTNIQGKPMKIAALDDDGEVKWLRHPDPAAKPPVAGDPEMANAHVKDLLRIAVFTIPDSTAKKADSLRAAHLWNSLERSQNGAIEIHDKTYEWFFKLLKRDVPVTAEAKSSGILPKPYSFHLWGINHEWVVNQLKDSEEQKTLDELVEAMADE
ncbi:hypothetical protein LCGC14_1273730 [marine sediment metagenome]|uniref:Uncharacterized protein n=1 Tax=marine sediment metagenome TaxID=412755 RepID=A0A0F9KXB7_9ZZZZ